MAKDKGQHNQRYPDIFLDQHGREYYVNCEKATHDPVSIGIGDWKAPIEPAWARNLFLPPVDDTEVVKVVPYLERNRRKYQIHIDYERWVQKTDEVYERRQASMVAVANEQFKGVDLMGVMDGTNIPPALLKYVGAEPMPPREIILAMAAGNKWALGQSKDIPEKAVAVLNRIRPQLALRLSRATDSGSGDPFAADGVLVEDEDDEGAQPVVIDPFGPGGAAPLDAYGDIEEQYDPQATGGKRVPPKRRKAEV